MEGVDKIAVRQMVDREILNTYMGVKSLLLSSIPSNLSGMAQTIIKPYEQKWINNINSKVDVAMELSFPTPETTLEEGMDNLNNILNEGLKMIMRDKLNLPESLVNLDLNQFLESIR